MCAQAGIRIVTAPAAAGDGIRLSHRPRATVSFVRDLFEPGDVLAIKRLLLREICHYEGGSGSVPALNTRRDRHDAARGDLLLFRQSERDDRRLVMRMTVSCGPLVRSYEIAPLPPR